MSSLQYMRDEMRRSAAVNDTKPVGSPTMQNLATNRLMSGITGGLDAATGLGLAFASPSAPVSFMARLGANKLSQRSQELVMQELRNRLLNPEIGGSAPSP